MLKVGFKVILSLTFVKIFYVLYLPLSSEYKNFTSRECNKNRKGNSDGLFGGFSLVAIFQDWPNEQQGIVEINRLSI